ncbi:Notoamide biosynthesis cluster protein M' [Paramyrothecium foliicola]|nr:Notoamide biosynthesis cluster protein M' [Paramyrothecium foliicola]
MQADPGVLYMISLDYDGYHEFRSAGYLETYFLGTSTHAIVWSYDPNITSTVGIFIQRRPNAFNELRDVLRVYENYAFAPQILCCACCLQQLHRFDDQTQGHEHALIRQIEDRTGYGPKRDGLGGMSDILQAIDPHKLTKWSQGVAEVMGHCDNKMRHQRVSLQMLRAVREAYLAGPEAAGVREKSSAAAYEASLKALSEAIPHIEGHMEVYQEYIVYLKERASRLSTVLFALITHEDADATIGLAAATSRDSSSMKTVAVVTMAFLPATFFAALFALPISQWEEAEFIQRRFWIYWAFTLPTTALVFGTWLGLTQRVWISETMRNVTLRAP